MVAVQVKCVVHEELGLRAANHTRALLRIRPMQRSTESDDFREY